MKLKVMRVIWRIKMVSLRHDAPDYADCSKPLFICCYALWKKHKHKLLHSYSRTSYLLSPDPSIMEHAKLHLSWEDFEAMDELAIKLLMPMNVLNLEQKHQIR